MSTLGFIKMRDDQSRSAERASASSHPSQARFRAYPTDAPFTLQLGGAPILRAAGAPIKLYRVTSLDVEQEQPTAVERYYAGLEGFLYPVRLKAITADRRVQTFANLRGLRNLFMGVRGDGSVPAVQDPVYAVQAQAFQTPLLPKAENLFCPDGLSPDIAFDRIETLLRLKLHLDAHQVCPQMYAHTCGALDDALQQLHPPISRRNGLRWGDVQSKSHALDSITLMTHGMPPVTSLVDQLLPPDDDRTLAYSPPEAGSLAQHLDQLPLTDFAFTAHYEEGHPLTRKWEHVGDRYHDHLTDSPEALSPELRRVLIDQQVTTIVFQATLVLAALLESGTARLEQLPKAARRWLDRPDCFNGPYALIVTRTHLDEVRLVFCPKTRSGQVQLAARVALHLDLPFMALTCPSLVVR